MKIQKINSFMQNTKNYRTERNPLFKAKKVPRECFKQDKKDFSDDYGQYRGIITYNEILALKKLSEESSEENKGANLAIAIYGDPIADFKYATSQEDLINGKAEWYDITDKDNP